MHNADSSPKSSLEVVAAPGRRALYGLLWALLGVAAVLIVAIVLNRLHTVVRLFAFGYLFAYLFHPLVLRLEARRLPRPVTVAFVVVGVVALIGLIGWLAAALAVQLVEFSRQLPALVTTLRATLETTIGRWQQDSPALRDLIAQATLNLQAALGDLTNTLLALLRGVGTRLLADTVGVISGVLEGFVALVIGVYLLGSFDRVNRNLLSLLPWNWQPLTLALSKDVSLAVGGYLRGQALIALSIGTMIALGMAIIGEPLALALGFVAGLFNIVPYLGVVIAIAPALLLALPGGLLKMALVVVIFVVANQLEGHLLSPLILARSTNLHPVTVVLAVLSGLTLGGILGGVIAVPLAALGKVLIEKYWMPSRLHRPPGSSPAPDETVLNEPALNNEI